MAHIGDELRLVLARDLKLVALLDDLVKQARVLDRDNSLVGEGVDEFDLPFGKRAHFCAPDHDHANCLACVEKRDTKRRAPPMLQGTAPTPGVLIRFRYHVCDVNRSPVDDYTPWDAPTHKSKRVLSHRTPEGNLTMVRDKAQAIAKQLIDHRVIRIAQPRRGLDQRIEYPLQIEG